jgi:hypothetical protein
MADGDDSALEGGVRAVDLSEVAAKLEERGFPPSVELKTLSVGTGLQVFTQSGAYYEFRIIDPAVGSAVAKGGTLGPVEHEVFIDGSCLSDTGTMLRLGHVTHSWRLSLRLTDQKKTIIVSSPIVRIDVAGYQVVPPLLGVN